MLITIVVRSAEMQKSAREFSHSLDFNFRPKTYLKSNKVSTLAKSKM